MFLGIYSCVPYKQMRYMAHDGQHKIDSIVYNQVEDYKLGVGDLLNITVKSTAESNADILGKIFISNTNALGASSDAAFYVNGYLIDTDGNIELPYLGKLKVMGLTCDETTDLVEAKLHEYLNHITVSVRLTSFRVTGLGEFARPSTTIFYQKEVTIFQAISAFGDMTNYANRKKVKLIRHEAGQVKVYTFDLTQNNYFNESFYRLKPNDVIYVEAIRAKVFAANSNNIALVLSLATFTLLIITYINK
jgi:polysaccharide export outer membrane protein